MIRTDQAMVLTTVRRCLLANHKLSDVLSVSPVRAVTVHQYKKDLERAKSKVSLKLTEWGNGMGGRTASNRWRGWFCWWFPQRGEGCHLKMRSHKRSLSAPQIRFSLLDLPLLLLCWKAAFCWCTLPLLYHTCAASKVWPAMSLDMQTHLSPSVF